MHGQLDGAARQRSVAGVEPPARRGLPAARRPHGRSRARPARGRGAGRAQRRSRRPVGTARARLRPLARAGAARPRALTAAGSGRRVRRGVSSCRRSPWPTAWAASATAGATTWCCSTERPETPLPWANVIANPAFGTVVTASGSAYTWAGNSRENRLTPFANDPVSDPTAEALFVRDDETGEAWSPTPGPMRRTATSRVAGPALGRPHPLLADRARHPPRARRLRGRERSREALAADADERGRRPASPERLRLQRVDPGSATRGPGAPRRDRARRGDRRDPRAQSLQHRVPRTRGLRPRERGRPLGDRRPGVVPGPQRVARAAGGPRPRGALRPLRRGPRSLRGAAAVASRSPPARRASLVFLLGQAQGRRRGSRARLAPRLRGGGRVRARRRASGVGPDARRGAGAAPRTIPSTC